MGRKLSRHLGDEFAGATLGYWISDALMAIFFLPIGLELERELYVGESSNLKNALLPIAAAIGGMVAPALIDFSLNSGTPTQAGFGIPMATDIAFAVGALALLGKHVPVSLMVFLVAFAVIDDVGAIIIIATFYTAKISIWYLAGAIAVWAVLIVLNRFRIMTLTPYLPGGALMWFLMLKSGVHATHRRRHARLRHPVLRTRQRYKIAIVQTRAFPDMPVAFIILPIFALANTGIVIGADWMKN
jgi:Na+:H+ antiporter, NhaA family